MRMEELSEESREFLKNLRLYLLSSGKKDTEIEDIVGELEDHLSEAEKDGKSVEMIIGRTPKAYMDQLAGEMSFDPRNLLVYGPMILLGVICFDILNKAADGIFSWSLLEITGNLLITLLGLILIILLFKYVASRQISKIREHLFFYGCSLTPIVLFVGLTYLDRAVVSPVIHLGTAGQITSVTLACLFLIGVAIWSKTWVSVLMPAFLIVPELLLNQTGMDAATKSVLSLLITFSGIGIYLYIVMRSERKKAQAKQSQI